MRAYGFVWTAFIALVCTACDDASTGGQTKAGSGAIEDADTGAATGRPAGGSAGKSENLNPGRATDITAYQLTLSLSPNVQTYINLSNL